MARRENKHLTHKVVDLEGQLDAAYAQQKEAANTLRVARQRIEEAERRIDTLERALQAEK